MQDTNILSIYVTDYKILRPSVESDFMRLVQHLETTGPFLAAFEVISDFPTYGPHFMLDGITPIIL